MKIVNSFLTKFIHRDIVFTKNGNVRIDTWIEINKDKNQFAKISHFGKTINDNDVYIKDFSYTKFNNNEIENFTSVIKGNGSINGSYPIEPPPIYISPDGKNNSLYTWNGPLTVPCEKLNELESDTVKKEPLLYDNESIIYDVSIFEDTFDIPYVVYGMLVAALSASTFNIPFNAVLIFDSEHNFNIYDISIPDYIDERVSYKLIKQQIYQYEQFLSAINNEFKRLCQLYNISLRAHGIINPFNGVLELFNKDFPTIRYRTYINSVDHSRILRILQAIDSNYINSGLFDAMIKNNIPSAFSVLLEPDESYQFINGIVSKYYVSEFN